MLILLCKYEENMKRNEEPVRTLFVERNCLEVMPVAVLNTAVVDAKVAGLDALNVDDA